MNHCNFDVTFKTVGSVPMLGTVYPASAVQNAAKVPVAVYFHSGGLTGGNRNGFFPAWLADYCAARSIHLVTFDYRLIPTCTIQALEDDLYDAYDFSVSGALSEELVKRNHMTVDPARVAVCGASAGGYAATILILRVLAKPRLPKPSIFLCLYGETNLASSFYNVPKVDSASITLRMCDVQFLFDPSRGPVTGTDVRWFQVPFEEASDEADREAYAQTNLTNIIMQDGITASVLFQQPDLSQELAKWAPSLDNDIDRQKQCIPLEMLHWFPIPRIHSGFPKTLLLHGEHDAAIPWQDSDVFSQALSAHGVDNRFVLVRGTGSGHGFDRGQGFGEFWDLYMAENLEWLFRTL